MNTKFEQETAEIAEHKSFAFSTPVVPSDSMHPLFPKASGLTETIIGAAIEVSRQRTGTDRIHLRMVFHE